MASVDYRISNFDGLCFKSGLYVGTDTDYTKIINSAGIFVGAITPSSISTTGTLSVTGISTLSGQVQAGDGSAATPSYSFINSPTTGFYRAGTNILGFSTAGVSAGTIDASQLWYIGGSGATFISGLAGKVNINRDMTDFTTHAISTETQTTISGNTALSGGAFFRSSIEATVYRQVSSGTITDNFGFYAAITGRLNFAINGGTYTTNTDVPAALLAATCTVTGGGTKTITNLAGLHVQADSQTNITRKMGIYLGGPTAGTNNAYIADNVSFTGSYFINSTSTNPSLLSGQLQASSGTVSAPGYSFSAVPTWGFYYSSGSGGFLNWTVASTNIGNISSGGAWTLGASGGSQTHVVNGALNPSLGIIGVTTNSSAAAGTVGQYVESVISSYTNITGATGVWGNLTTISLTAGDWDVTGILNWIANGATIVGAIDAFEAAISVNSGATTTDHVQGSNQVALVVPTTTADRSQVISSYRISLSATTTIYLKLIASYSVATPQYKCRLSARRVR